MSEEEIELDQNLPQKNELVVATISKIVGHGVYAKLLEYPGVDAYCHISEVAPTWIRNIRNHVRIDQQVVAKVMRVDKSTGQVDISIKRVSDQQKKEKIREYRLTMSAKAIVRLIAERVGKTPEEIEEIIVPGFKAHYYTLYAGFEAVATDGELALENLNLPDDLKQVIVEIATASIKISIAEHEVIIGLRSFAPDGVFRIKEALMAAEEELAKITDIEFELISVGAPKYRLYLASKYYEEVEDAKRLAKDIIQKKAEQLELDVAFTERELHKK